MGPFNYSFKIFGKNVPVLNMYIILLAIISKQYSITIYVAFIHILVMISKLEII